MRRLLLMFAVLVLPVAAFAAGSAPRVSISTVNALPKPLPLPYDEKADATARVMQAFANAKKSGKRVLVDFGGNWCPDCRILAGVMNLPEVKSYLARHYEIVAVDIGRFDRNMELVGQFGITQLDGVPTVVIAEADGKLLNVTNSADLSSAGTMKPQAIADWLARWTKPARTN
jgi:thioredoxin-like negative regulator of GroEL